MKTTKRKIKRLIKNIILEMNSRDRNFAAAQRSYDNMQPPGFNYEAPDSDDIFDYAFEESIESLVEAAEDEGLLFYDDSTQIVTDRSGYQVGHYVGSNFNIDDHGKLVNILKSSFNPELYVDSYNEYLEQMERGSALDALELERDIRASEYDGEY